MQIKAGTLSKSVQIDVDLAVHDGDFKTYKNHPGKFVLKEATQLPVELEEAINNVISGKK